MSSTYADHQEKISKIYGSPEHLPLQPKQRLLEYGCGVGALSRSVALKSIDSEITAIDINKDLIELGKIRAHEQGIKNITFLHGNASAVQNLNGAYDGAYCRFLLEEFAEPTKIIKSMSSFVKAGGWLNAYERLNNYCRLYPHSESVDLVWKAIYEFYRTSYGASPNAAENLQDYFLEAGLKDIRTQGFSRILSAENDQDLFSWYIESALSVIEQMEAPLREQNLVQEQILTRAKKDYRNLLDTPNAFILEATVSVMGTK